ncbi:MAG: class B sortase [Clostridia bacterium]|nr:class B sortase [Clostridia bacterium]
MSSRRRISKARKIILLIAVPVFVLSIGIYLFITVYKPAAEKRALNTIVVTQHEYESRFGDETTVLPAEDEEEETITILAKYAALYEQNPDLRGWIKVPAYKIDSPVVQGPDNDYYLRRGFNGEWARSGTPFFDYRIRDFKNLPRNTVIYGHNMQREDIVFGVFENLRTVDGYRACPVIQVDTIYREYRWFVYAVFVTNIDPKQDNGHFFEYNFVDATDEDFEAYIEEINRRRLYSTGVELTKQDRILTISTCGYDFYNARFVVVARMQRKDEPDVPDVSLAKKNPDPKYPQVWYDTYGGHYP